MGKNPQQIMARKYNYIFRQLVKDKNDICGHIAYSIYKFDKVSYLDTFKKENGREPNEEEMNTFHNSCCTPARIEEYKHHAQSILGMFSNEVLRAAANQIENDYIRNQDAHMKHVLESVLTPTWKQYLHGIAQSVLGAFVLAFILWLSVSVVNRYSIGGLRITVDKEAVETNK
ncbi:hypothetical protein [Prevotella pectinovora]|jgi:hypothetical protein|uniref:hypothetical protein n=1 Tax=Prevotella pectinovora TaxID=1602169 RepID=UPI00307BE227